jgi:aspartyl-tRNA(Asn)/glutamyl-tRNA(Gln) amidotransferase subunit C
VDNTQAHPALSRAEVEHIATLARLALTDAEMEHLATDMASILRQVATLNEIDTSHISPSAAVLPLDTIMQDDEARPSLSLAEVLANAPSHEDGHFRVPAILEE